MFDGLEDNEAGSADRGEAPVKVVVAAAREIVSQGRIEFDEDGELVGFRETLWRRDAAGGGETKLLPLTPCKADGADEPADEAEDTSGVAPADLIGSLDTFEKYRPRDWLGFMVPVADEQRYTAEERYRQRSAPVLEAARLAWMGWLDRRAESLDDLRTPRVDASAANDSPVLLERHGWRHSEEVRALVRGGVPHELRARIWPLLCGSSESARREGVVSDQLSWTAVQARVAEVGSSYEQLHELGEGTVEQIEKDVPRTFSRNDSFKEVRSIQACPLVLCAARCAPASFHPALRAGGHAASAFPDLARICAAFDEWRHWLLAEYELHCWVAAARHWPPGCGLWAALHPSGAGASGRSLQQHRYHYGAG
jgi:hypothetical protein